MSDWITYPLPKEATEGHSEPVAVLYIDPSGRATRAVIARRLFRAGEPTGLWRETSYPYPKFVDASIYGWSPIPPIP